MFAVIPPLLRAESVSLNCHARPLDCSEFWLFLLAVFMMHYCGDAGVLWQDTYHPCCLWEHMSSLSWCLPEIYFCSAFQFSSVKHSKSLRELSHVHIFANPSETVTHLVIHSLCQPTSSQLPLFPQSRLKLVGTFCPRLLLD
jgi:hypothetical protein